MNWGQYSKSRCDVADDVIVVKIVFICKICHLLLIFKVKLKLSCARHGFRKFTKTVSTFRHLTFKPKSKSKLKCVSTMSLEPLVMTTFVSTFNNNNWPSYGNFKIWPTSWPYDVIDDVINMWHRTCTVRYSHLYSCKTLLWHQSFTVKSSERTSWQIQRRASQHTGWKHFQLGTAGDNHVIWRGRTHSLPRPSPPPHLSFIDIVKSSWHGLKPLMSKIASAAVYGYEILQLVFQQIWFNWQSDG